MTLLGIDYGTKKVGVAVSDETESIATPVAVFPNDVALMRELGKIIASRNISGIVVGESKNLNWQDNPLMKKIHAFTEALTGEFNLPINLEPEFFTTQAARFGSDEKLVDAAAAALILQSFIDKRKK